MERKVYIFLADGFEEIEGLTVVDIMRRAGICIQTVSIKDTKEIEGSHGIRLSADLTFKETDFSDADMLVLPGGMPGTRYLKEFQPLRSLLTEYNERGGLIGAICAAPTVLSDLGFLKEKTATSFPSCQSQMDCAEYSTDSVVPDGNIITSRGLGTALDFSLALTARLLGEEKAQQIAASVVYNPSKG